MKVIMINGSHNEFGCTYTALNIIKEELKASQIDAEIIWVGNEECYDYNGHKNAWPLVQEIGEKMKTASGLIVGSPTWYSHPSGRVLALLDRLSTEYGPYLAYKPAASIATARRAGQVFTNDVISKHFSINNMPIITSSYWNLVFASTPEEVYKDEEGVATMQNLAHNMAWILKSLEKAQIAHPTPVKKYTNFHH